MGSLLSQRLFQAGRKTVPAPASTSCRSRIQSSEMPLPMLARKQMSAVLHQEHRGNWCSTELRACWNEPPEETVVELTC